MPSTSTCRSSRRQDSPIDESHGYLEQRKKIGGHVPNQKQGYEAGSYASQGPFRPWISLSRQCQNSSRETGYRTSSIQDGHFRSWMFLARASRLQICIHPKSNTEFWINKISGNRERDAVVKRELEESGWKVIVVWECSIRHSKNFVNLVNGLCNKILNNS